MRRVFGRRRRGDHADVLEGRADASWCLRGRGFSFVRSDLIHAQFLGQPRSPIQCPRPPRRSEKHPRRAFGRFETTSKPTTLNTGDVIAGRSSTCRPDRPASPGSGGIQNVEVGGDNPAVFGGAQFDIHRFRQFRDPSRRGAAHHRHRLAGARGERQAPPQDKRRFCRLVRGLCLRRQGHGGFARSASFPAARARRSDSGTVWAVNAIAPGRLRWRWRPRRFSCERQIQSRREAPSTPCLGPPRSKPWRLRSAERASSRRASVRRLAEIPTQDRRAGGDRVIPVDDRGGRRSRPSIRPNCYGVINLGALWPAHGGDGDRRRRRLEVRAACEQPAHHERRLSVTSPAA